MTDTSRSKDGLWFLSKTQGFDAAADVELSASVTVTGPSTVAPVAFPKLSFVGFSSSC